MRKIKPEEAVSRRKFCKWVFGLVVATGGKIGVDTLWGIQIEEGAMTISKISEVPKEPYVAPLFTGPDVTRQSLVADSKDLRVSIVNFGRGVRNKFHTHNGDQLLIITAGKGIVATVREERVVSVGEVVLFPAGEKHWHGATKDSEFSHIVVTKAGSKTTQLEK
jgi:quercetin dioxygenase-like cupin family protein